jgi:hypothetical protein
MISDLDASTVIEDDIRPRVKFVTSLNELMDSCVNLIKHDGERVKLEQQGFACMSRRDIAGILRTALR